MSIQKIERFKVIGISTETTNENGKSVEDLGKLWKQFFSENIPEKVPNKISEEVFSIYTDYETDYTGKYTTIIGVKVDSLDKIPNALIGREVAGGLYKKFVAKGEVQNAVVKTWKEIWQKENELNREYLTDFEVYGEKSQNGENSEVEIFVGIK